MAVLLRMSDMLIGPLVPTYHNSRELYFYPEWPNDEPLLREPGTGRRSVRIFRFINLENISPAPMHGETWEARIDGIVIGRELPRTRDGRIKIYIYLALTTRVEKAVRIYNQRARGLVGRVDRPLALC